MRDAAVAIHALAPSARFVLRLPEDAAAGLGPIAGLRLDLPLLRSAFSAGRYAARLGPDEWLLGAPETDAGVLSAAIGSALAGRFHALVDIGHRNEAFEVSGPGAAGALNAGCPLDLGDAAFPVGAATRTILGKAEIVLMRTDGETYRVECWRSYAPYVHAFLREAAA